MSWEQKDGCYFKCDSNYKFKERIIAFDFDGTLFASLHGNKFPRDENDLKLLNTKMTENILKLKDKYCIVIISNQGGVSKGKITLESAKRKLDKGANTLRNLGIPVIIMFSTQYNNYRKPHRNMWRELLNLSSKHSYNYLDSNPLEIKENLPFIYVGDAAGRIKTKSYKKDFSTGDRMFAYNIRAQFLTPEIFMNNSIQSRNWTWGTPIYPIDEWYTNFINEEHKEIPFIPHDSPEMIIMTGYQGSGKSSYSNHIVTNYNYKIINRDTLGTIAKCEKKTKKYLIKNKSVIIDNTNPSSKSRANFIKIAKSLNIYIRSIWISTSFEMSFHLNKMRTELTAKKSVPAVAYYIYRKNFEKPNTDEGFDTLIEVPFYPKFNNEKIKSSFLCHYDIK